jgi:hypothetical protein
MSEVLDNKYFIILNKNEIIFSCIDNKNKISFTKYYTLINGLNNLFVELENFFTHYLIEIEKNLKDFIKNIYIIIDTDNSLSVDLSIKYKLEREEINENKINDLLASLKYQFTKYSNDQKVIHMTISKFLIDGKKKDSSLMKKKLKNLILEVKFECLKDETVHMIKKIFSNYQISVEKILLANYLRSSFENKRENIIYLANKIITGEYNNEIVWVKKKPLKQGFFERFFNYFN